MNKKKLFPQLKSLRYSLLLMFILISSLLVSFVYAEDSSKSFDNNSSTSYKEMITTSNIDINSSNYNSTVIYFFYGEGCSHCANMDVFLESLERKYPKLNIKRFETHYNKDNYNLFKLVASLYGTSIKGVPTLFVDNEVFVGSSESTKSKLKSKIEFCLDNNCLSPDDKLKKITSAQGAGVDVGDDGDFTNSLLIFGGLFILLIILMYFAIVNANAHYNQKKTKHNRNKK